MLAYSMDLRMRVVEAYRKGEGTQAEVAKRFKITDETVGKWNARYEKEGHCEPRPHGGRGPKAKLDEAARGKLEELLRENPDATLAERCRLLAERTGVQIGKSTMHRLLSKMGVIHKKSIRSGPRNLED